MNSQSLLEWGDRLGLAPPARRGPKGAILRNYRLCFPRYDEVWGGGIADVVPDPGKSVAGVLFDIHRISLEQLDRFFLAESGEGQSKFDKFARVTVPVHLYTGGMPVEAVTYRLRRPEWGHVPPSSQYLDRLIEAAGKFGLSSLWVMYLQSFATQQDRNIATPCESPATHFLEWPIAVVCGAPMHYDSPAVAG